VVDRPSNNLKYLRQGGSNHTFRRVLSIKKGQSKGKNQREIDVDKIHHRQHHMATYLDSLAFNDGSRVITDGSWRVVDYYSYHPLLKTVQKTEMRDERWRYRIFHSR
jgi:hypothetical protein